MPLPLSDLAYNNIGGISYLLRASVSSSHDRIYKQYLTDIVNPQHAEISWGNLKYIRTFYHVQLCNNADIWSYFSWNEIARLSCIANTTAIDEWPSAQNHQHPWYWKFHRMFRAQHLNG